MNIVKVKSGRRSGKGKGEGHGKRQMLILRIFPKIILVIHIPFTKAGASVCECVSGVVCGRLAARFGDDTAQRKHILSKYTKKRFSGMYLFSPSSPPNAHAGEGGREGAACDRASRTLSFR